MKVVRNCDSPKEVCQLMERCDGYWGSVRRYGKVRQLTGSVTVIGDT